MTPSEMRGSSSLLPLVQVRLDIGDLEVCPCGIEQLRIDVIGVLDDDHIARPESLRIGRLQAMADFVQFRERGLLEKKKLTGKTNRKFEEM